MLKLKKTGYFGINGSNLMQLMNVAKLMQTFSKIEKIERGNLEVTPTFCVYV